MSWLLRLPRGVAQLPIPAFNLKKLIKRLNQGKTESDLTKTKNFTKDDRSPLSDLYACVFSDLSRGEGFGYLGCLRRSDKSLKRENRRFAGLRIRIVRGMWVMGVVVPTL